MSQVIEIPLVDWLPDQPDFKNPGCEVADNVYPDSKGFRPFAGANGSGVEINDIVKGSRLLYNTNGDGVVVGGTDDDLFVYTSSLNTTTGLTSIGDGEAWDFAQFNDFVIATAVNNDPQYLTDIDTDTTWSALTGSPPQAKRCAKVGEFLMLGGIDGFPNRIQWSSYNSPAGDWTASRLTQAGFADLPKQFGEVQRIIGGRYALVFQERGITRLNYVGPPTVWSRTNISEDRGALSAFSVVQAGYFTFFLARDGFYVTNGASVSPIGTQRVNRWFFDNVNQLKLSIINAAIDWENECIIWAFPSSESETNDRLLIYSLPLRKWSTATVDTDWLVSYPPAGLNLDQLDAVYGDLDSIPVSLDSSEFKSRANVLSCFTGATSELSTFNGTNLKALIETGEFQPAPNRRSFVSGVTPLLEADDNDADVTLMLRDNLNAYDTSQTKATGWDGAAHVRGEGMKMSVRVEKDPSDWNNIYGIQVEYSTGGRR